MKTVREYYHLYEKVYEPGGYRYEMDELPRWMYLTVETDEKTHSKVLYVHSRIHVNKKVKVNPEYSDEYDDLEIVKDLSGKIAGMFLNY